MFERNFWKKTCVCFVIILPVLYLLAIFTNDDKTDKKELSHSNSSTLSLGNTIQEKA